MREKQCKYVNGFVYSFYLFFSSLLPTPPHLLMRHLWLCAAVPLCLDQGRFRAICWGRPLAQSHRAPGEVLTATFDTTAARTGPGLWCVPPNAEFSCFLRQCESQREERGMRPTEIVTNGARILPSFWCGFSRLADVVTTRKFAEYQNGRSAECEHLGTGVSSVARSHWQNSGVWWCRGIPLLATSQLGFLQDLSSAPGMGQRNNTGAVFVPVRHHIGNHTKFS